MRATSKIFTLYTEGSSFALKKNKVMELNPPPHLFIINIEVEVVFKMK